MTTRSILRLMSAFTAAFVALAVATPAHADVGIGWSEPDPVNLVQALLILGGLPIVIGLVITLAVLGPGLARGEGITDPEENEAHWLGGPAKQPGELTEADAGETGGASGRY